LKGRTGPRSGILELDQHLEIGRFVQVLQELQIWQQLEIFSRQLDPRGWSTGIRTGCVISVGGLRGFPGDEPPGDERP
jgi:hypothetical protein